MAATADAAAAAADADEDALYGGGPAVGGARDGDVGLGGDAAVAEEAALEDEGAGAKGKEGGEGGGEEEEEEEDDGVDVIIDQEDLQTPGRPGGTGAWGGAAAMVSPRCCAGSMCRPLLSLSPLPPSVRASCQLPADCMRVAAEPQVCAQGCRGQAGRAGDQGGRGGI